MTKSVEDNLEKQNAVVIQRSELCTKCSFKCVKCDEKAKREESRRDECKFVESHIILLGRIMCAFVILLIFVSNLAIWVYLGS